VHFCRLKLAAARPIFAVRPKTGEIVWKHQVLPRDNWDQECTFEMMVISSPVNPDASAAGMLSINRDARRGPRKMPRLCYSPIKSRSFIQRQAFRFEAQSRSGRPQTCASAAETKCVDSETIFQKAFRVF
jgi:hypothetical protein